jgi:DNA-binding NarL/FixJ family response regulator
MEERRCLAPWPDWVLERLQEVAAPPFTALTDRECQVVEQLARGLSYEDTGLVLSVSTNTARTRIRAIDENLSVVRGPKR